MHWSKTHRLIILQLLILKKQVNIFLEILKKELVDKNKLKFITSQIAQLIKI